MEKTSTGPISAGHREDYESFVPRRGDFVLIPFSVERGAQPSIVVRFEVASVTWDKTSRDSSLGGFRLPQRAPCIFHWTVG